MNIEKINATGKTNTFKFFSLMSSIYVALIFLTMVIENHVVILGSIKILSGTLVIPLSYAISDVIAEIYGYYEMRRLIWVSIIVLYGSAFIIFVIMHLPVDVSNHSNDAYKIIFGPFLKDVVTYSIATFLGVFLNTYLISKWKILVKGRYFWLRSLGASMIGEAIFITTWGFLGFSDKFPLKTLLSLMLISYLCKLIYNLCAIIPTSILVVILRNAEGEENCSRGIDFNPFAWQG